MPGLLYTLQSTMSYYVDIGINFLNKFFKCHGPFVDSLLM